MPAISQFRRHTVLVELKKVFRWGIYAKIAVDPASQQEWRLTHRQYFLKLQYLFRI